MIFTVKNEFGYCEEFTSNRIKNFENLKEVCKKDKIKILTIKEKSLSGIWTIKI